MSKSGSNLAIAQIKEMAELHHLQFNLLGNSLEALFLPSAIVITEGKTDKPYIEKVMQLRYPDSNVVVLESQSDVQRVFRNLGVSFGDFQKSPFRQRTFVVLDSVHSSGTRETLIKLGAMPESIIDWSQNGIEYVYPADILATVFCCDPTEAISLIITGDNVTLNGVKRRKTELGAEVILKMIPDTVLPTELNDKLVEPVGKAI